MPTMPRFDRCGVVLSDSLTSISDLRERTTVSSNPTYADGPHGRKVSSWDGTDDKAAFVGTYSVKTVFIRCYLSSLTEQIIDLDGGSTYIHVVAGVVTPVGFTSPTTYVDGSAGTAITADAWHSICVTDTTAETASSVQLATDNTDFGQVRLADMILDDRVWTADEISAIHAGTVFDYDRTLVSKWDMSNINPPDIGHAGNGNNGTGTNIAAADIVFGPYMGRRATDYDGSSEYTTITDDSTLQTSGDFSVSFVFKTTSAGIERLLAKRSAADNRWLVYMSGGVLYSYLRVGGAGVTVTGSATVNDGAWHHAVAAFDRDGNACLFVDGVLDGNPQSITGEAGAVTGNMWIGQESAGGFGEMVCADVAYYNTAMLNLQAEDLHQSLKLGAL